jgi:hypothetical protein
MEAKLHAFLISIRHIYDAIKRYNTVAETCVFTNHWHSYVCYLTVMGNENGKESDNNTFKCYLLLGCAEYLTVHYR